MEPIKAPIKFGETGTLVANLQEALKLLLERELIRTVDPPGGPTAEELANLIGELANERTQSHYGKATQRLAGIIQLQEGLGDNLGGDVEGKTADALNRLLNLDATVEGEFTVRGIVSLPDGTPAQGIIVRAFDVDLRWSEQLGRKEGVVTGAGGRFEIHYSKEQFGRSEKGSADLVVRAFRQDGTAFDPPAGSPTLFNAPVDAEINLSLPESGPSIAEFKRNNDAIKPLLAGQSSSRGDLSFEDLKEEDLDFLAGDTGIDRRQLSWFRMAYVSSTGTDRRVPPEAFYGWFRQGLPTDLPVLWSMKTVDLIAALRAAIDGNLVPRQLAESLGQITAAIDALRLDGLLKRAGDRQPASLGDLLGTMPRPLSPEKERIVAQAVHESALSGEDFAKRLADSEFDPKEIASIQVTRALGELTLNHTGVVRELQSRRGDNDDSSLRFLASVTPLLWLELAYTHQDDSVVAPSPEVYAAHLERTVEALHPTAVLAARIRGGQLDVQDEALKTAAIFLAANPGLELKEQNARAWVNGLQQIEDKEPLIQALQRMQRMQNLAHDWREAGALLNGGFGASRDIVLHRRDAFVESIGSTVSPERAAAIFDEAKRVHDTTVALIGNAHASRQNFGFMSNGADPALPDGNNYPNIRQLFGNLSYCECQECQSVLSPAAYLVDLLRFLDPQTEASRTEAPPLWTLLGRRPDIADLELTCENTRTEIPYVDLVLEVLENAIGLPIEIPKPYGFDPQTELMQTPVPDGAINALRRVLERSAISVGDRLTIQQPLIKRWRSDPSIDWLITDGARHWALHYTPPSLTSWRSRSIPTTLTVTDYAAAVAALDLGRLPNVDWIIPTTGSPRNRRLPLEADPRITQLEAGKKWSVKYTRAVRVAVLIAAPTSIVILKTADGQRALYGSGHPPLLVAGMAAALTRRRLTEPLISMLPGGLKYKITPDGSEWLIESTGEFTLTYVPERLEISSLTYQTSDGRSDLLASPENRNPAAYDKLDGAVYPWTLPFNLWIEEVRVFLDRRGVPRRLLMEHCDPAGRLTSPAIAREVLGLSLSESTMITSAAQHPQWEYWGLRQNDNRVLDRNDGRTVASGSWLEVLGWNVAILLQQSSLNYRELMNVLQTRFVLAQTPDVTPAGDECNPSKMKLVGLQPEHLDRIHRLVRLWRKLNWSIFDVDRAIAATTQVSTDLDEAALQRLAGVRRLKELLGLPVPEIAAWWGSLTASYHDYTSATRPVVKSLYERLFLNPTIANPPDRAFKLNDRKTELDYETPARPDETPAKPALSSRAAPICAALGITQADFDALTRDLLDRQELSDPVILSLANLSLLFRNVSLAKSLHLSIESYLRLKTLLAEDPFASPAKAIEFVEEVGFVSRSGFSIDALEYLLGYKLGDEPSPFMPTDWAAGVLGGIRSALQGVQKDVLGSADTPAANLRKLLAGIGWYDALVDAALVLLASGGQLEVQIAGSPAITIPQPLAALVAYRAGILSASPAVTAGQWDSLDAANAAAADANAEALNVAALAQAAILALRTKVTGFVAALPSLVHPMQSFQLPVFSVRYDLPAPPVIPRDLSTRCYFDAALKTIVFSGWMTDAQRTELGRTLPAAIVDQLKTDSTKYQEAAVPNRFLFDVKEVQKLFSVDQTPDTRVEAVLQRLLPYLYRKTVGERLSQAVGLSSELMDDLLATKLDPAATLDPLLAAALMDSDTRVTVTPGAFPLPFEALCKVHKAALVCRTLQVELAETRWLPPAVYPPRFHVLNLDKLPVKAGDLSPSYEEWQRLVQLFRLRAQVGAALINRLQFALTATSLVTLQPELDDQLAYLAREIDSPVEDVRLATTTLRMQWKVDYQNAANIAMLIQWLWRLRLARAFQLSHQDVDEAITRLNLTWPADFQDPARVAELLQLLTTLQRLGAVASDSFSLVEDAAADENTNTLAKPGKMEGALARKLLRARYDEQAWPQQLKPIADVLRQRQRDALVAYLISRPPKDAVNGGLWTDAGDVYEHYLIDPEMSPCRVSTRILHAISAVQLFVQRCALKLEPGISPAAIDPERLKWMSQFRVWQANRLVFLYPENWLEPELRDDKSELFKNLEGQIQQSEFDAERANEILKDYLKQLEDISHLTIVGMYVEKTADTAGRPEIRVHTVGRTQNRPSRFFYRRWIVSDLVNHWEPWEHITLEGVKSDHILPFVMRGDVYIAWPEITQMAAEPGQGDNKAPGAYWRVQLAWVRRTNRGWSDRLMSSEVLEHPWVYGKDENQTFTFKVRGNSGVSADIDCYGAQRDPGDRYIRPPAERQEVRKFVPFPADQPWVTVKVGGVVWGSYLNDTVFRRLKGATVVLRTRLNGTNENKTKAQSDLQHDMSGFPQFAHHDTDSIQTDDQGLFDLNLRLVAQLSDGSPSSHATGYFETSVLDVKPSFEVEIESVNQPDPFTYTNPNDDTPDQYLSQEEFHQNFIIKIGGTPPAGDSNRQVSIGPIGRFSIFTADDVEFRTGAVRSQFLTDGLMNNPNVLTYGSGFKVMGDSSLRLPDDQGGQLEVWTGVPSTYWLLPAAPFETGATEVCVYRDSSNSYFIRKETPAGKYQILIDGHPRARDLRIAVSTGGVAACFELSQEAWPDSASVGNDELFDNHRPGPLVDSKGSLTRPAVFFEPDNARSPSASYNTELFFHVPLLIATYLSRSQRFADAQQWFHYVFSPSSDEATDGNERYWRYPPFRTHSVTTPVDELLKLLANPATSNTDKQQVTTQIQIWSQNPFRPHAVARLRLRAYECCVVFKYLDNLIAWGDSLFRQYSTESINTATQLYILAAKLLGPRPQSIPRAVKPAPLTYRSANNQWDLFSNAWLELEAGLSQTGATGPYRPAINTHARNDTTSLTSVGMLYFCVPGNEKMLEYWDTIANRLFNIRHCRNIEGVQQDVPLFQPPIDPALLVRATAAGLDISAVLADINTPLPLYRFGTMAQKASELCAEVKALGGALLSVLEKKDAEELSQLRSSQELGLLTLMQTVKERQIEESRANIDVLSESEKVAAVRFNQYQRLLGKSGAQVPDDFGADVEQISTVNVPGAASGDPGSLGLTQAELDQITWSEVALLFGTVSGIINTVSGILFAIPDITAGTPFINSKFGGTNLGSAMSAAAAFVGTLERNATAQATRSATVGQYQRRQDEWVFQSRLALRDVLQIRRQKIAAQIRLDIATQELANHKQQMKNAQDTDRFMREKYTNLELYQWMTQQLSGVYFRAYQLAYDVAKRAERAFRFELGLNVLNYIQFGYWDGLKKGLLAGERLSQDLKRLEVAYLDQNQREYEITKHISVLALDPAALLMLRQTGTCEIVIPEVLFDLDYPGHYFRRIKSVGLTLPCVTGPYTGVSCTLTLLKSSIRKSNEVANGYRPDLEQDSDPRFRDIFGAIQSIVTSSGQQDSGLFEANLRDERYLPFEGSGAINSRWRLEIPTQFRQFDYDTLADVILHIRYTARQGGALLKEACQSALGESLNAIVRLGSDAGLARLFSLKQEFPSQWAHLKSGSDMAVSQGFALARKRFPLLFSNQITNLTISSVDLYLLPAVDAKTTGPMPAFPQVFLPKQPPQTLPVEAKLTDLPFVGRLVAKRWKPQPPGEPVFVAEKDEDAIWRFDVAQADVAQFRRDVNDIILVCHYVVG